MSDYTILCVDDEENVLKSLKRLFLEEDWELITADSGKLGLEVLREKEVHLIIADFRMPEMTGVEFLKEAKEIRPEAIRIILSGFADVDAIVRAINEGEIYKFISKPWNDEELKLAVRRSLEQFELIQENSGLNEKIKAQNEELRTLNENLEAKVQERTAALQLRNQALSLAQDMLEQLPIGIVGISMGEEIALINSEMISIFGLVGKPVLGMKMGKYFPEPVQEYIKATLQTGNSRELKEYRHNGRILSLTTRVIDDFKEPKGVMLVARRQMQGQDNRAERASTKEDGCAQIRHQIHEDGAQL